MRFGCNGSGRIEWVHMPPAPGCHFLRVGCLGSEVISCQLFPPSSLRNNTPGSPPHQSAPSPNATVHSRFKVMSLTVHFGLVLGTCHFLPALPLYSNRLPKNQLVTAIQCRPVRGS